jgi:hypothetical protein
MGESSRAVILVLAIIGLTACGDDDDRPRSAREIVQEHYPHCLSADGDDNITVKDGVIKVNCGIEHDGPVHYLDATSGAALCSCGFGGTQCEPNCPPPAFR